MKLAILGGTKLATNLGNKFLSRGVDVIFGVRENFDAKEKDWKILSIYLDKVFGFREAIEKSEIILICCENVHLEKVCDILSTSDLKDKIIIDCTNGSFHKDFQCNTTYIQEILGDRTLFKAFNNLGLDYPESDMMGFVKETYFCGDETYEKLRVKKLIELIGFKAIDVGVIENALLLEAFYHLRREITLHKAEKADYHFKLMSV